MERTGVALGADGAAEYFKTLDKVNQATLALLGGAERAVAALNDLDSAERKAGKGAKGLGDDTDKTTKQLGLLERAVQGAGERVGHLAVDLLADAGQAVLQFGKDGVKAAGDFQSGMQNFEAVVGDSLDGSGQSAEQFRDLFISLGRDLPVSTQEVQQAAIEMAKGGIEPATIAAGGLEQTLKFAAAANLGLAEAAEIAAKTVGGWAAVGATAEEKAALLTHATDLLAKAANASTVDVDELAKGLYNAQGAALNAGVSLDETVTTLAAVSSSFASSSEAGNSFKNFMARLQPQTNTAAQAMADLGLLTKDGTSAFYDAQGAFIGMSKASDLLNKATKNLSAADRSRLLQLAFGNDAQGVAVKLAQLGAAGYDEMTASIAKQLGVAEQAAKKQQGWNVALDNLSGSIEAFQITVFSQALPALTALVNLLAGGLNAITDYAAATAEGQTALSGIISFIETAALPTIYGLTAAMIAYAISGIAPVLTSLPAMTAVLIYNTSAFLANAAAVVAAAAPYVLLAAAVAGVAYAWNDFNSKIETATQELLSSKPFWQESTAILEEFGSASEATRTKLQPLADSIQMQRDMLEANIESLGRRQAAGLVSEEQFAAEMAQLNGLGTAITFASKELDAQVDAEARAQTASMTATTEAANLQTATANLGTQASLTAQDIEELGKKIQDTYAKGQEAVAGYATNQSAFLTGVEERATAHKDAIAKLEAEKAKATTAEQKKGIDEQIAKAEQGYRDQETKAAESYARQQAEQQAHLGQMLIDYTVAQATLGNIPKEKAAEITAAIAKQYGIQESDTSSTFLKMAGIVDTWSKDTGADTDTYIQKLKDTQQAAADTQTAEDKYYKDSATAAAATFTDKGGDVKEYIAKLEDIPLNKSTAIELPAIDDRYAEIEGIDQGLRRIPTHVTIRVDVQDKVPKEYKPGSPTPFELGIRGITKALSDLSQQPITLPDAVSNELRATFTGVGSDIYDTTDNLRKFLQTMGLTWEETNQVDDALHELATAYQEIGTGSPEVGEAVHKLGNILGLTENQILDLNLAFNQLVQGTTGTGDGVINAITNLRERIDDAGINSLEANEAFGLLADTLGVNKVAFQGLRDAVTKYGPGSQQAVDALLDLEQALGLSYEQTERLSAALGILGSSTTQTAQSIVESGNVTADAWGQTADDLSSLIEQSDLPGDAADLGDAIMEGWAEGMEDAFDDLLDQVNEWSDQLKQEMNEAWDVSSPSGITRLLGENIMLGLLGGLDDMLPDLLDTVQSITSAMAVRISEIDEQLQGKITDTARAALEAEKSQLEAEVQAVADTVGQLPDLINSALADAYGGMSDFLTTQSGNLRAVFDIGKDTGELDRAYKEATDLQAKRAAIEAKLAEAEQKQADIASGKITVGDKDRAAADTAVDDLRKQLMDVGDQQMLNEIAQKQAEKKQQDLKDLQGRTQQALSEAQATASAMDDPTKAAAYLKLRSEQILREADLDRQGMEAKSDEERTLIANQLILERQAHEAALKAFELGQDQLSATHDLTEALNTLNDNLDLGEMDMPPELTALYNLLVRLTGMAAGGTMQAMHPYLVGEAGPELVVPRQTSDIFSALDTRRALAPAPVGGNTSNVYGGSTVVNVDARGSNLSESQITRAVWAGISAASGGADVRMRTGVG